MSSNVIDFRKWVRAIMRKIKGIAEVGFVGCDAYGPDDGPLPDLYDFNSLSENRVIDGKRVGDIRAEQLEQEKRDIKFDDTPSYEPRAGRASRKRKAATNFSGAAEE